jgi:hypothetical protein
MWVMPVQLFCGSPSGVPKHPRTSNKCTGTLQSAQSLRADGELHAFPKTLTLPLPISLRSFSQDPVPRSHILGD